MALCWREFGSATIATEHFAEGVCNSSIEELAMAGIKLD